MAPKRRRVSKSGTNNNDHEMSTSLSVHETVKGSHEYKIQGYSLAKGMGIGKYMTSGKFTVGGHEWAILFNPDGNTEASKEYISLFLQLVSPKEEVRALYDFKLLDQTGKNIYGAHNAGPKTAVTFKTGRGIWGIPAYMKRLDFETSNYLKDDCLSIRCMVRVVQTRVEERKQYVIPVPPSDMSQNLKGLLESESGSDITFQVGDKSFKAHKSILAARCPVFKAQFFGSVGKPDLDTVVVEDFGPFAFKAMLLFLYSDEIPEPRELSDLDSHCTSTSITQHLLVAADRYVLSRLKLMCEAKLCEGITANTVAATLALADHHQCLQLKTACLNFAAKPENLEEFTKSDGFAHLEKCNPSLLIGLLKASAVLNKK